MVMKFGFLIIKNVIILLLNGNEIWVSHYKKKCLDARFPSLVTRSVAYHITRLIVLDLKIPFQSCTRMIILLKNSALFGMWDVLPVSVFLCEIKLISVNSLHSKWALNTYTDFYFRHLENYILVFLSFRLCGQLLFSQDSSSSFEINSTGVK
jgi:hypothetical protein